MSKSSKPFLDRPYRLGVGIVLLNPQGLVFVAQRIDTDAEAWQMPQGGIDKGEDAEATAFREMEEEIGTKNARLIATTDDWVSYDLPQDIADRIWKGRYRGQKQKWFLLEFTGTDSEINIDTDHPEFCKWKWAEFEDLPNMIVPFKKPLYQAVVKQFHSHVVQFKALL